MDPGGHEVTDAAAARVLVIGGELNPAIAVTKTPSATGCRGVRRSPTPTR